MSRRPVFKIWQQQFGLFCDELGVWRCVGRLGNANLPFETKHPVFLDSQHHLATLIVLDAHDRVQHNGVSETLTEQRQVLDCLWPKLCEKGIAQVRYLSPIRRKTPLPSTSTTVASI